MVSAARQEKEQAFGIPVVEPAVIGPPPQLQRPGPQEQFQPVDSSNGVKNAIISEMSFGRSVNSRHKRILAENSVVTLYDAMKLGQDGLENIDGIGGGVATAVMSAVEKNL